MNFSAVGRFHYFWTKPKLVLKLDLRHFFFIIFVGIYNNNFYLYNAFQEPRTLYRMTVAKLKEVVRCGRQVVFQDFFFFFKCPGMLA